MSPKKIYEWITDTNKELSDRMYVLLTSLALMMLTGQFLWEVFIKESALKLIVLGGGLIAMCLVLIFSLRFNRIQLGAIIICSTLILIVLPIMFYEGDGAYGGTPIWCAFFFMYVGLNIRGKLKYLFMGLLQMTTILWYLLAFFYPQWLKPHEMQAAYQDSLVSVVAVGMLLYLSVEFMHELFDRERRLAEKQKEEIENLNTSQSRFFSSMSHEIRTPINTIIGLNEMNLRENVSKEVAENSLNIQAASKMLLALINDILDMSKIESGKMDIVAVPYNVGDMMSDIVNLTWVRAKDKNLGFHIDIDSTIPSRLHGDEVRIKQILINIINNAIKYTSEGEVRLSIQCRKEPGQKVVMIYSVSDTGMGIKKESLPYLFTAFKRVDEVSNRYIEGTGLGLSIVKQLVDLMGGTITVNSVYTKGSTFVVEIPQEIVDDSELGELNLETRHSMNTYEHYKQTFEAPDAHVLVVDDNDTNIMVAEKLLRDTKVQIDTAMSGEEALKKTLTEHFEIILMDHLMPKMDGIECLHRIREQVGGLNKETPVVVLTANAGSDNQTMYKREGFDGYILKPVSGELLEREIVKHLPKELVNVMNNDDLIGDLEQPMSTHKTKIPIMITTDSVCDLPQNIVRQRGIPILPYHVITKEGTFLDGLEAETEGIMSYMEEGGEVKSEPPKISEYEEFFAEQLGNAQHIVHITMAKNVSNGYENAKEAAKAFDNVTVLDSGHLTTGMGLLVMYANILAREEISVEDLVKDLKETRNRIHTGFVVNSTEYLARSGRISHRIDKICRMLLVHPVIVMKKNSMKVRSIKIGTRDKVWKRFIDSSLDTLETIDDEVLFVATAALTLDEIALVEKMINEKHKFKKIIFHKASPTIAVNCGPGSLGLMFMTKS